MMGKLSRLMVIKKDGRKERFRVEKLRQSIERAAEMSGVRVEVSDILNEVLEDISSKEGREIKTVEIADLVEKALISKVVSIPDYEKVAKVYVLGRIYNEVYGKGEWVEFTPIDMGFTYSALRVLYQRYLLKDLSTGKVKETPEKLLERVAKNIAKAEAPEVRPYWEAEFKRLMAERKFVPNSPTLFNAGTKLGILSACFVIPVRDAMTTPEGEGIYDSVRSQAIVFQQGGGCGFDFSELRPEGDSVASTAGVASGPLSFMRIFDVNTDVIKQGGRRRGANMGVLHVWHPDIKKFIKAKTGSAKDRLLQNFNISVGMYDYFMKAMAEGREVPLINPRKTSIDGTSNSLKYAVVWARHYITDEWVQEIIIDELEDKGGSVSLDESLIITWEEALAIAEKEGAISGWVDPSELFDEITNSAWEGGDPGLLFIDTINKRHPTWYLGKINATNPCGEQPLLEWESCNLGSINLEKYVVRGEDGRPKIDWRGLAKDVEVAVRFLDNVISVARYPLRQLEVAARRARKVGLGVMGWAHMLIKLGIPYDSPDAVYLAYVLSEWIAYNAYKASVKLAEEKGPYPTWNPKLYRPHWRSALAFEKIGKIARIPEPTARVKELVSERPEISWDALEKEMLSKGLRNAALLSIAPTGTISIIAGTSSSIEPVFALAFTRMVTVGTFIEVDPLFLEALREFGLDEPEVIEAVAETGSVAHNPFIPRSIRNIFRTAHDVSPLWHVLHQAAWQQWVDAGVSKTVNMRNDATVDEVKEVYLLAWALGCKGITVYRDKSKSQQVINFGVKLARKLGEGLREEVIEKEEVRGAETIVPEEISRTQNTEGGSNSDISKGNRFRISGVVLEDGDVGDCATCEY
ncbi:MAG: adenosylcobalamin-dependent ribonucleoside-diphosphate reductase [Desulfurococcales archaeon]|nr:adenosylcobalamin-dependent ribonucleoside-diphosphate reductase [Desulfurococcales archaeon]